ncbi:unnamed protein product [Cyclocybe aegerita]|uniref:Copper transport protein n=1 Tax=Cyclocybe aegerita TaxID=1973307 RepID=A0A8S0WFZ2_CYCAE|nr:unnamed protein product [Cyclocybe aegerita]
MPVVAPSFKLASRTLTVPIVTRSSLEAAHILYSTPLPTGTPFKSTYHTHTGMSSTLPRFLHVTRLVLSLSLSVVAVAFLPVALAHGDSPSSSSSGAAVVAPTPASASSAHASMVPYLHFTPGVDTIFFLGWVPRSAGAIVGTCIGLFVLAIMERWVAAMRARAEAFWRYRAHVRVLRGDAPSASPNALEKTYILHTTASSSSSSSSSATRAAADKTPTFNILIGTPTSAPPFILTYTLARGAIHALQAALGFAFMLVVMTYNAGYILSIILGLGVGEAVFGRFVVGGVGGGEGPQ